MTRVRRDLAQFADSLAVLIGCTVAVVGYGVVFYWIPLLLGAPVWAAAVLFSMALLVAIAILETLR